MLTLLLRYSFYDNVQCVRLCQVSQESLYRDDGKLLVLFAKSTAGNKAFFVDAETADVFVRHPVEAPGCRRTPACVLGMLQRSPLGSFLMHRCRQHCWLMQAGGDAQARVPSLLQ